MNVDDVLERLKINNDNYISLASPVEGMVNVNINRHIHGLWAKSVCCCMEEAPRPAKGPTLRNGSEYFHHEHMSYTCRSD